MGNKNRIGTSGIFPIGSNPRFVVTNLLTEPQALYDQFYVQRGASSEHRIKELKLDIKADRISCQQFLANQFRLFSLDRSPVCFHCPFIRQSGSSNPQVSR